MKNSIFSSCMCCQFSCLVFVAWPRKSIFAFFYVQPTCLLLHCFYFLGFSRHLRSVLSLSRCLIWFFLPQELLSNFLLVCSSNPCAAEDFSCARPSSPFRSSADRVDFRCLDFIPWAWPARRTQAWASAAAGLISHFRLVKFPACFDFVLEFQVSFLVRSRGNLGAPCCAQSGSDATGFSWAASLVHLDLSYPWTRFDFSFSTPSSHFPTSLGLFTISVPAWFLRVFGSPACSSFRPPKSFPFHSVLLWAHDWFSTTAICQ
jgi:hypothetical protein